MTPKKRRQKPILAFVENRMIELQRTIPTGIEHPDCGPKLGQPTVATFPVGGERDDVMALPWSPKHLQDEDEPEAENPLGLPKWWTSDLVKGWLGEAMQTLRRLPATGCFPGTGKTSWPEWVRDVFAAYGSDAIVVSQDVDSQRRRPTILEMGRLDIALRWPFWIPAVEHRVAAVLIAQGVKTRIVGRVLGCAHETARQWAERSYQSIADLMNEGELTEPRKK